MIKNNSIERAFNDLISHKARLFFSIVVVLSVIPLVWGLPIEYVEEDYYGFASKKTFFDYLGLIIAPIICSVGLVCGAYKSSVVPVLFMYFIDIFWVFDVSGGHYTLWNITYSLTVVVSLILLYKVLIKVSFIQDQNHKRAKAEIDKIEQKRIEIENNSQELEQLLSKLKSESSN